MTGKIDLLPVSASDEAFLMKLFEALRAPGYEKSGGHLQMPVVVHLQFKAREQALASKYGDGEDSLILVDGTPVGRYRVVRREDEFQIGDLSILPEYQRRGIGSELIAKLTEEARVRRVPILVQIGQRDLTAAAFFKKMHFEIAAQDASFVTLKWQHHCQ